MKFYFAVFLLILSNSLFCQKKLLTYKGTFSEIENRHSGDAQYTYYLNENNNRIFNGLFKYMESDGSIDGFSHLIPNSINQYLSERYKKSCNEFKTMIIYGEFVDDFKDKTWTVMFRDLKNSNIDLVFEFDYSKGILFSTRVVVNNSKTKKYDELYFLSDYRLNRASENIKQENIKENIIFGQKTTFNLNGFIEIDFKTKNEVLSFRNGLEVSYIKTNNSTGDIIDEQNADKELIELKQNIKSLNDLLLVSTDLYNENGYSLLSEKMERGESDIFNKVYTVFNIKENGENMFGRLKRGTSHDLKMILPIIQINQSNLDNLIENLNEGNVKVKSQKLTNKDNEDNIDSEDKRVYSDVEQMPEFAGGEDAIMKFFKSNLKYPTYAKENKIAGNVHVSFIIKEDGSVSDAKIIKGLKGGCDEEALRLVNSLPKWRPGKQGGKPVKISFGLTVPFNLNE